MGNLKREVNRREFARLFAAGGSAALFLRAGMTWPQAAEFQAAPAMSADPWEAVRAQFVMPPDMGVMNAANLCPSPLPVLEAMYSNTKDMDADPSFQNRAKMSDGKDMARQTLADYLNVSVDEIVITRNTSESNNIVSSGIELGPGDEVLLFSDNHPSNNAAWKTKAERFGFTVKYVEQVNPHPGADYYLDAFSQAIGPATRVVAFTHLTNTVGDLFPARELCQLARERGALSLVDGAQTFGLMNVDLADMQPDFYSGSAHKWPCGPKEVGVLYVNQGALDRLWPSVVSAGAGPNLASRKIEALGQRDEPAIIAFAEAIKMHQKIGKQAIQDRSLELAQRLMEGLKTIEGVTLWTNPDPKLSAAVVSFQPGNLDARQLHAALYENDRIGSASRGGDDRGGIRISPHFYNLPSEIDRAVDAVKRYMSTGL